MCCPCKLHGAEIMIQQTIYHSGVIWALRLLKSLVTRLFVETFVEANITENTKASHLWEKSTGDWWINLTKDQ